MSYWAAYLFDYLFKNVGIPLTGMPVFFPKAAYKTGISCHFMEGLYHGDFSLVLLAVWSLIQGLGREDHSNRES